MTFIREWRWNERHNGADGVSLFEDRLAWWSANWETPFAEGGGADQTFEDFLADGPVSSRIPAEALDELRREVQKIISSRAAGRPPSSPFSPPPGNS
jgi:hypothetical protein